MSNDMEMKIHDFIECLKANDNFKKYKMGFNLFSILGVERNELIHSKVLAYFLNPKENHNLGDKFIKEFFKQVIMINDLSFDDFKVTTEVPYRIDIFLLNKKEKYAVVIENKIDTGVHSSGEFESQLTKYKVNIGNEFKDEDGYRKNFILLSPTGYESYEDGWQSLSYKDIVKVFKSIVDDKLDIGVRELINSYVEVLEKKIMEVDNEIKESCQKIYDENKDAIEFIMDHIDDRDLLIANEFKNLYSIMEEKNPTRFIYSNNPKETKYISFRTSGLNKFVPGKEAYFYVYLSTFRLVLQYSEDTKDNAKKYCEMLTRNGFKEIKLYTKDALIAELDRDSDYVAQLEKIIQSILDLESK